MKKIDLIRAIFELHDLKILNSAFSFKCIEEIMKKTITGTNKNFDKESGEFLEDLNEEK